MAPCASLSPEPAGQTTWLWGLIFHLVALGGLVLLAIVLRSEKQAHRDDGPKHSSSSADSR